MRDFIKIFIFVFLFISSYVPSVDGFDVPKIPGVPGIGGGGDSGVDVDALTGKQSELVKSMAKAILNLTEAQVKFLEGLGEKEAAIAVAS